MPMSPRLLRPRSTVHPEAQAWATRVVANGGTFSGSTLSAVSKFCRDIDATSGLRAAILRLNLFCGNNLEACLVPLYRAASLSASVLGNTTDTNANFVSGDYTETGSSGGLKGNGSTKSLNTGFSTSLLLSVSSSHLSVSASSVETSVGSGGVLMIGVDQTSTSGNRVFDIGVFNYSPYVANQRAARLFSAYAYEGVAAAGRSNEPHIIATRTSSSLATLYGSGSSLATDTATRTPAATTNTIVVFATNSGSVSAHSAMRARCYSIGNGLTAAQAIAFSNAVIAFNTALGRA